MANNEWITIFELSRRTGVHEESIVRYISAFSEYLPQRRVGSLRLLKAEASSIVKMIWEGYKEGKQTPQIRDILNQNYNKEILDVATNQESFLNQDPSNLFSHESPMIPSQHRSIFEIQQTNAISLTELNKMLNILSENLNGQFKWLERQDHSIHFIIEKLCEVFDQQYSKLANSNKNNRILIEKVANALNKQSQQIENQNQHMNLLFLKLVQALEASNKRNITLMEELINHNKSFEHIKQMEEKIERLENEYMWKADEMFETMTNKLNGSKSWWKFWKRK